MNNPKAVAEAWVEAVRDRRLREALEAPEESNVNQCNSDVV